MLNIFYRHLEIASSGSIGLCSVECKEDVVDKVDVMDKYNILEQVRLLSEESHIGLLFCYKALKMFEYDYQQAFAYLQSDEFKDSIHT